MEQLKFDGLDGAEEATVTEIHVKVGQDIKKGEKLIGVEADKASGDISALADGKVAKINFKAGDAIKIGDVLVEFGSGAGATPTAPSAKADNNTEQSTKDANKTEATSSKPVIQVNTNGKVLATPLARKMARDLGIDMSTIQGSGPLGRILKDDLLHAKKDNNISPSSATSNIPASTPAAVSCGSGISVPPINVAKIESFGPVEHLPLSGIRKAISNAMSTSLYTAPHVSLFVDINAEKLVNLRAQLKEEGLKHPDGEARITFMCFFVKAVAIALREDRFKLFNSTLNLANNEILVEKYYNIGMAADTDKGLVVPVIKDADKLSLFQTARKITELGNKAKSGTLKGDEMQGGTFTITNFGSAGLKYGTAIINYPEVAILGLGAMEKRAMDVKDGKLVFNNFFPLSISIDHRVLDGAPAGYFLHRIKELLENPYLMLV